MEADLLIHKLAASGSFVSTHLHIGDLSRCSQFSPAQVEQLIEIVQSNHQVGWIVGDPDVRAFYSELLDRYGDSMSQEAAAELQAILSPKSKDHPENDEPAF